jgi:hypothetical protein
MRAVSVVISALFSLLILPNAAWALPLIIVDNTTPACVNGIPSVTITVNATTWGAWNTNPLYFHNPPTANSTVTVNSQTATFPVTTGSFKLSSSGTAGQGVPSGIYTFTMPTCPSGKMGMTWVHGISNAQTGTITVGCGSCNATSGDTICTLARPLLCIYKPTPPFSLPTGVSNANQYSKWSGGVVATTAPVQGAQFAHLSNANAYCQADFGPGWRTAEFHDGWGWNFQAYGGTVSAPTVPSTRFWVNINDQAANCWTQ